MREEDVRGYRKQIVKEFGSRGLTDEELSEIMGLAVGTVKKMRGEQRNG